MYIRGSVLCQLRREVYQILHAIRCDPVLVFDADAAVDLRAVQARLGCEDFAFDQTIVPFGIQMWELVRLQPDAMPQMMWYFFPNGLHQVLLRRRVNVPATHAWFGH